MFFTLFHCSMEAEVIGKRVDRGRGNRLEILVRYLFLGPAKAIDWLKRKLETVEEEYHKLFNIIITNFITLQIQEQSPISVLQIKKRVLQICSKYTEKHPCRSVSSVKLQNNFIEITLPHGCSPVNLLHICRKAVLTNTHGELLLQIFIQHACHIFQYKFVSNLGCFLIYF